MGVVGGASNDFALALAVRVGNAGTIFGFDLEKGRYVLTSFESAIALEVE